MAKKGEARENITLKCTVCGEKNYRTPKNKRNTPDRIELKKHCPKCGIVVAPDAKFCTECGEKL